MIEAEVEGLIKRLGTVAPKRKSVLVTGGAGFLGSWLCHALLALDCSVVCMDNFASGKKENIFPFLKEKEFTLINHDVSTPFEIENPVDFVFHLASRASPFEFELFPLEIISSNTFGTMNSLNIAKKFNSRFVFTSTSEIYGDAELIPTPESYNGNVNTVGIRGCYDEAKRLGETICMAYHRQFDIDIRIARIFNTYGPRMRSDGYYGRVVPRFIEQALKNEPLTVFGDGNQTRSFCYITDQIEGLIKLASVDGLSGEIVNIGNPKEYRILSLAEKIIALTSSTSNITHLPLPADDPKRRCPVIEKAEKLLNWHPQVSLDEGLQRTIEYHTQ